MFDHCVTSITVKGLHHSPCNLPILRSPDHAAILVSCQFIDYPSVFFFVVVVVAFFCLAKLIFFSFQLQLIYICLMQKIIQYDCKISGPLSRYHIMVSEVDSDEEISTNGNKEIC